MTGNKTQRTLNSTLYLPLDSSVGGNLRMIPDGPSGDDVGAGCLHNLPHFTDGYFTGARLLNGGWRGCG